MFVVDGSAILQCLSWAAIEFLFNSAEGFWCDQAHVTSLRIVLAHQSVKVLHAAFLPAVIGLTKIAYRSKRFFDPSVLGKLKPIVVGDGVNPIGLQNCNDRISCFRASLA